MSNHLPPTAANVRITRSDRGEVIDDASCRCSVCGGEFQNVAEFDRHRFRGRCRTPDRARNAVNPDRPNVSQADRDSIEDVGLAHDDNRAGSGDHAQHHDELVASCSQAFTFARRVDLGVGEGDDAGSAPVFGEAQDGSVDCDLEAPAV
jgi:hypothetical protein